MARRRTERVLVSRFDGIAGITAPDTLAVEEPLEIRLDEVTVATTMRTPGHDFELAAGFCHGEGLLAGAAVQSCRYCATGSAVGTDFNVVTVSTGGAAPAATPRLGPTTSSCGWCGTSGIDDLVGRLGPLPSSPPIGLDVLAAMPDRILAHQELFAATGAVHAAASFDRHGDIGWVREDIGRHNAVDKVVGRQLLDDALPATGLGLFVSGRASFEMVQKAWAAGFAAVVAVSAPSSLAVAMAREAGLTLAGFARSGALTVYAAP